MRRWKVCLERLQSTQRGVAFEISYYTICLSCITLSTLRTKQGVLQSSEGKVNAEHILSHHPVTSIDLPKSC